MKRPPIEKRRSDLDTLVGANLSGNVSAKLNKEAVNYFLAHPAEIAAALQKSYEESHHGMMNNPDPMTTGSITTIASPSTQRRPRETAVIPPQLRDIKLWTNRWPVFCKQFGLAIEIDFRSLYALPEVAGRRSGLDAIVYCPTGTTIHQTIDLCRSQFPVWEEPAGAIDNFTLERGCEETDLVLCRLSVDTDSEWTWKSADSLRDHSSVRFLDARERYMLEAFYFWLSKSVTGTGLHLDLLTSTRCPRSRDPLRPDHAAAAFYDGKEKQFWVFWGFTWLTDEVVGAREAVPITVPGLAAKAS